MVDILFGKESSQSKNHYKSSVAHDYYFWLRGTTDVEVDGLKGAPIIKTLVYEF